MARSLLSSPAIALAALVTVMAIGAANASYLTGSPFPWEGCKRSYSYNRWLAHISSYTEDAENGSEVCFQFGVKPRTQCEEAATDAKLRCCDDNNLQKLKIYVDSKCRDTRTIQRAEVNGRPINSVYRSNNPDQPYIKITGMEIPFAEISNSTLCITLRGTKTNGPCPTLPEFANSFTRATGKLEYALYDIKNQYECCPHFVSSIYGPNSNGPAPVQQPAQPRASTAGAAVPSTATSPPPASPAVPNPPSPSPSLPPASPDVTGSPVPVPSPPASPAPVPAPATPSYSPSTYSPPSYAAPTYAPPSYGTNPAPAYGEQQQMASHEQQQQQQQQQRRLSRRLV